MALSETAQLAVLLTLKDQLSSGLAKAEGQLAGFNSAAGKTGSATTVVSGGMGKIEKAATGVSGALTHFKGAIGGLVSGPLGLIGLGAGLFTFAGILKESIGQVESLGLATEKLSGVTGENAQMASSQIAVFTKYGLAIDKAQVIAAFAEKTLGKLSETQGKAAKSAALLGLENTKLAIQAQGGSVKQINLAIAHQKATDAMAASAAGASKLVALDKQYGLSLVDAKGKVVDFQSELLQVADLFTRKSVPASERAAVAAQLFGRSYVNLIPLLKLGSKGILEAEASAAKLGLTITAKDLPAIQDFIHAQRVMEEALGGAKLQIGLALMPLFTDLAKGITSFLANGGTQQLKSFFQGVAAFAREAGTAITQYVLPVFGAIAHAWGMVPGPLKSILIAGVVGNKVLKVAFGFDPLKIVGAGITDALGGAVKQFFGRGSPANPMFVVDESKGVGGLLGGAGAAGAAGEGGLLALFGGAAGIAALVGIFAAAAVPLITTKRTGQGGHWVGAGQRGGMTWVPDGASNPPGTPGGLGEGGDKNLPSASRVLANLRFWGINLEAIKVNTNPLHVDFRAQLALLKTSLHPTQIAAAAVAVAKDIGKGVGNLSTTRDTLASLTQKRDELLKLGDTAGAAKITAAIKIVAEKLPGREMIARQIQQAQRVAHSSETTAQKVGDLQGIQKELLSHGDTAAASIVSALLNQVVPAINSLAGGFNPSLPGVLPGSTHHATVTRTPRVGIEKNRAPLQITVKAASSARSNGSASVAQGRYGPTAVTAGAAVVLP